MPSMPTGQILSEIICKETTNLVLHHLIWRSALTEAAVVYHVLVKS